MFIMIERVNFTVSLSDSLEQLSIAHRLLIEVADEKGETLAIYTPPMTFNGRDL